MMGYKHFAAYIYRMAQPEQWVPVILDYNYEEGEVEKINCGIDHS